MVFIWQVKNTADVSWKEKLFQRKRKFIFFYETVLFKYIYIFINILTLLFNTIFI